MQTKKYQKYDIISVILIATSFCMLILSRRRNDSYSLTFFIIGFSLLILGLLLSLFGSSRMKKEKRKFISNPENTPEALINKHKNDNVVFDFIDSYIHDEFHELNDLIRSTRCIVNYDYSNEDNSAYLIVIELIKGKKKPFGVSVISSKDGLTLATQKETIDIQNWTKEKVLAKMIKIIENEAPKIQQDSTIDFEIKAPKWQFNILLIFAIIGWLGTLAILILNLIHVMNLWFIIAFPAFFAFLGTLGIITYFREKFILKDGKYIYISLFRTQKCHYSEVEKVVFERKNEAILLKIMFYGRNGKKLISFLDDGTSFMGGKFMASLNHYGIKYIQNFDK